MPKESFYNPDVIEDEAVEFAHARAFNVAWGHGKTDPDGVPTGAVYVAGGVPLDRSGVERLIAVLRRARRQTWPDEIMPGIFESDEPSIGKPIT